MKWIRTEAETAASIANLIEAGRQLTDEELRQATECAAREIARRLRECHCRGYNHECRECGGTGYTGG